MGKVKKLKTEVVDKENNTDEVKESEITFFEFGDLYSKCSCGGEELVLAGIEGVRFPDLPASNKHFLRLGCKKCGTQIMLYYKIAEKLEELKAAKAAEPKVEEVKIEEIKEDESKINNGTS